MKRALLIGTAAAVLFSASLSAQGRNFAGSWVPDTEKNAAAGSFSGGGGRGGGGGGGAVARSGGGGGGGSVSTVDPAAVAAARAGGGGGGGRGGARSGGGGGAGAPMIMNAGLNLSMDANTFTIAQGTTTTILRTDGTVTDVSNEMRKASAKAHWDGDKLVVETTTVTPNGSNVTFATWYLEGESLVRENKSTGPDGQEFVRKTYFKRS